MCFWQRRRFVLLNDDDDEEEEDDSDFAGGGRIIRSGRSPCSSCAKITLFSLFMETRRAVCSLPRQTLMH